MLIPIPTVCADAEFEQSFPMMKTDIPYKHITVLIMPTDYCNMNCIYCFNSRRTKEKKVISLDTVKKIFSATIPFYERIRFVWHGGEPLSMGLDFYKAAVRMQKEMNINGADIENSIQSNLTLLTDEYVKFFIEEKFNLGGSFDGTHNELTRHNSQGILRGRETAQKQGLRVGFICVVQSKNIDCLIDDYNWFKSKGINYTLNQYLSASSGEQDELFVPAQKYIHRICELFDYWVQDHSCNIQISYFNELVTYMLFKDKSLCCYNSCMGKHVGIHHNGDIYNCNRDFSEEYCYGNIYDYEDIRECFSSKGFNAMLKKAVKRRYSCKESCEIYDFCSGGCNNCSSICGDIAECNEYVCETTKGIYKHIEKRLEDLVLLSDEEVDRLNPILSKWLRTYHENKRKSGVCT